jgi:autotransporter-associated beta strand protein
MKTMKPTYCIRFLAISIVALVAHSASAATITKAATGTDLNAGASWVGGVVPGASDIATWDSASLCTGLTMAAHLPLGGISVGSAASGIDITGGGWLGLGGGIDLSASTANLTLGTTYGIDFSGSSTWTVDAGKTLTVGASPGSVGLYPVTDSVLTVGGAGDTVLNAVGNTTRYTLNKTGTGTLTTTSPLRIFYGGNVNVQGGVLSVQSSQLMYGDYSTSGAITVSGGGVLELQNWEYGYNQNLGGLWYDNSAMVINGGTIRMNNTAATGDGRGFTIGSGGATLEANGGNNLWRHTGSTITNTANGALTLTGSGNGQMDKSLPGTAATATLTKSGTGTWTLTGANTYVGNTTITTGTRVCGPVGFAQTARQCVGRQG